MTEKYSNKIEEYCAQKGIKIPPGFYRHSASRYAVVVISELQAKLVAKTWFNQEDVVYYLKNQGKEKELVILDFKELEELKFDGSNKLVRKNAFCL